MIDLSAVVLIRLSLGTIKTGMSYTITRADGSTEIRQYTPALQAFLTAQGWIARRNKNEALVQAKNRDHKQRNAF